MEDKFPELEQSNQNLSIIEKVNKIENVEKAMKKIKKFQALVREGLKMNHDYGVVPGSVKPTLLKPGAEKILMLLGLSSEYELIERIQDYEKGLFAFTVKCKLYSGNRLITEGVGHANTREKKYIKQDPYTLANTILKISKKRAQIDATLTVASLSDIFTQDIEDLDLDGNEIAYVSENTFDDKRTISKAQAKRLYALSNGDAELCKKVMMNYGYAKSEEIRREDYDDIAKEIKESAKNKKN